MSTNESNDTVAAVMSHLTVADFEHVDTKSTDVESDNKENTEHKSGAIDPVNVDEEKGEEPANVGVTIESEEFVDEGGATSEPNELSLANDTKTVEHKVAGDAQTGHSLPVAVQSNVPTLADVAAQASRPTLADAAAQASYPSFAGAIKAKDGESPDAVYFTETSKVTVFVDVTKTSESTVAKATALKKQYREEKSSTQESKSGIKTFAEQDNTNKISNKDGASKVTDAPLTIEIAEESIASDTRPSTGRNDSPPITSCFGLCAICNICKLKPQSKSDKSRKSVVSCPKVRHQTKFQVQLDSSSEVQPKSESGAKPDKKIKHVDSDKSAADQTILAFLRRKTCSKCMVGGGKVVLITPDLRAKSVFRILVANGVKAFPIWDKSVGTFVGMYTVSDFVKVLRYYYYTKREEIINMENQTIETWRRITNAKNRLISVKGSESLEKAAELLILERIHRLPIIDKEEHTPVSVLTKRQILHYMVTKLYCKPGAKTPSFFSKTIGELKVGTFEHIVTVNIDSKVIDALDIFARINVSSLPVVDESNRVMDVFEKYDVYKFCQGKSFSYLDTRIGQVLRADPDREMAWILTPEEPFETVIRKFSYKGIHRIVVMEDDYTIVGIISLSDVLKFLVFGPLENSGLWMPSTSEIGEAEFAVDGYV